MFKLNLPFYKIPTKIAIFYENKKAESIFYTLARTITLFVVEIGDNSKKMITFTRLLRIRMGFLSNIFGQVAAWCRDKVHKRRVCAIDIDGRERWHINISPLVMVVSTVTFVVLLFSIVLILAAYTSFFDILPGYRTEAEKSREKLIENIIRLDSVERQMSMLLDYNESRILVMDSKAQAMRHIPSDSLPSSKQLVAPSSADSLLRQMIETNPDYRLVSTDGGPTHNSLNAIAPMFGVITKNFDAGKERFGIRITGNREAQVSAIADGMVIATEWTLAAGYSVTIQHHNGTISIYRHLAGTPHAKKGQRVHGGEVIGYAATEDGQEELSTLDFELWSSGKALNPEQYIIF